MHGQEPFDRVWLHLTAADERTVRIGADRAAVASGRCTPAIASRNPALVHEDSLAYLTIRRVQDDLGRWQLGAVGHGRLGEELAARIVEQVDVWDRDRTADPYLFAYPTGLPLPADTTGKIISKPHIRLVLRYDGLQ